ncbi:MAG: UDP-N-acetyl-D-glucosamine dehydrogenase, partial [Deltaproteobacteria bacterium]|nr:UDP-N-acetyl-D-glucosamine dehydrogenase [Deltaproteobacteria bacterium]
DAKSIKDSRVFIVGVAYKKDVNDSRESSAITVIEEILRRGGKVLYNDPYISSIEEDGLHMRSTRLGRKALASADCTLILTDHSVYSYEWIVRHSRRVFDTKNATKSIKSEKIVRL